ncbi:SDR family oxidoreductase [Falsirhodobacter sp. 1013]|uniref:SDR family oxidoreductase n=1 Tax=Falsirhodobacter sp. 1013 TaxID=3417566 RepID=UPI003EC0F58D
MNKAAVVTGGSAGIGLAIADRLARAGWDVAILARGKERLEEARVHLAKRGARVLALPVDVADAEAVNAAADRIEAELGPIGAWVNNAMSTVVSKADQITPEEYQRVTATTYLSQVYGTLAALRHMKPRRMGSIVQISSGLGIRPAPLQAAYCGAKAAVTGFTDALRAELLADEVPVKLSVVYLPAVNTPQPDWARNHTGHQQILPDPLFDPRLCAEATLSAIRHGHRDVWVGRTTMQMALVQAISPSFADRQVGSFIDAQMGAPVGSKDGNLYEPGEGPARIDGISTDRMLRTRQEFITSRHVGLVKAGLAASLLLGGAAVGAVAARALARR